MNDNRPQPRPGPEPGFWRGITYGVVLCSAILMVLWLVFRAF